ncbi:MAG TPA: type II toxin-antitoxin system Phd/YefM family antitoxin [Longimicrobium sp.]|nr:type II toxin-antitoxin system Phd/YefM family antitoxin [Longimicrobium sp.]
MNPEVVSLTDFQRHARDHVRHLRETRQPAILTVDGKPTAVVQDADAYQELLDRLDRAEAIVGINRGLVSMRRGEGRPAAEVFAELRATLAIPSRG